MKFLPLLFFIIILIRDLMKLVKSYSETKKLSFKDVLGVLIMTIGITVFIYYNFD